MLTDAGLSLFPIVVALRQWGERHCFDPDEVHSRLVHRATGREPAYMQPRLAGGNVLLPAASKVERVAGVDDE